MPFPRVIVQCEVQGEMQTASSRFELDSPCLFPTMIIVISRAPRDSVYVRARVFMCVCDGNEIRISLLTMGNDHLVIYMSIVSAYIMC